MLQYCFGIFLCFWFFGHKACRIFSYPVGDQTHWLKVKSYPLDSQGSTRSGYFNHLSILYFPCNWNKHSTFVLRTTYETSRFMWCPIISASTWMGWKYRWGSTLSCTLPSTPHMLTSHQSSLLSISLSKELHLTWKGLLSEKQMSLFMKGMKIAATDELSCHCCFLVTKTGLTLCDPMGDPLLVGFSRQECWSGLSFSSSGDLLDPGIEPSLPALASRFFTTELAGKPLLCHKWVQIAGLFTVSHGTEPWNCVYPGIPFGGLFIKGSSYGQNPFGNWTWECEPTINVRVLCSLKPNCDSSL